MLWQIVVVLLVFPFATVRSETSRPSEKALVEAVLLLNDREIGELLLRNQRLLGPDCVLNEDFHGLSLFKLLIPGQPVQRFGTKAPRRYHHTFKSSMSVSDIPKLEATYAVRSEEDRDRALGQVGLAFRNELSKGTWPCGTYELKLQVEEGAEFEQSVKFYRDQESGEVVCVTSDDKNNVLRTPGCIFEPFVNELPEKLCRNLLNRIRFEKERDPKSNLKDQRVLRKDTEPTYLEWSDQFRKNLLVSRKIKERPELFPFIEQAMVPSAEAFIDPGFLSRLERASKANELVGIESELFLINHSLKNSIGSDRVGPSPEFASLLSVFQSKYEKMLNEYKETLKATGKLDLSLYSFPSGEELQKSYASRVLPVTKILGRDFDFKEHCTFTPRIKPDFSKAIEYINSLK